MRRFRTTVLAALSISVMALGACGGGDDDGDGNGNPDGGGGVDAGPDAEVNTCEVLEASYGDLGAVTGSAIYKPQDDEDPDGPKFLSVSIPLNADAKPDLLIIELFEEADPYVPDLEPGLVTIIDMQADLISCGACVYIAADFEDPNMIDFHMAASGTVNIDTLDLTPDTGSVTGSLSNVKLNKVVLSGGSQQTVAGGCKTSVDAVSFDFNVTVPPVARQAGSIPRPSALPLRQRAR